MLDLTKERDVHIDQRLRSDPIIWLSTVRRDGRPHTVPVWFLWDGKTILMFSQPETQKIRNLRNNPNVTLALRRAFFVIRRLLTACKRGGGRHTPGGSAHVR